MQSNCRHAHQLFCESRITAVCLVYSGSTHATNWYDIKLSCIWGAHVKHRINLTYDAAAGTDGTGAQLQRVFALYAASKMLHLPYLHSELQNLTITPLDPFQDESALKSYLIRVNEEFKLPSSNDEEIDFDEVYRIRFLNYRVLIKYYIRAFVLREKYLLMVQNPFQLVEKFPMSFLHVQKYFHSLLPEAEERTGDKTIVIHVRRGSNGADLLPGETTPRMLPNSYYFDRINEIRTRHCEKVENIELVVITDTPKEDFKYTPLEFQLPLWSNEPRFQHGGVEIRGETFREFELDFLSKFTVIHGGDPILALRQMQDADFLVMSRSSFSYVGAILNSKGKVFYPPNFWHRPMKKWIKVK